MKYAANTNVGMAESRTEIEETVTRYGAEGFMSGWSNNSGVIAFDLKGHRIRLDISLPEPGRYNTTPTGRTRSGAQTQKAWDQGCRQCWRALALVVLAKLEAIEAGISTIEQEFLYNLMLPNGDTVGQRIVPNLAALESGEALPPLLSIGS